MVCFSWQLKINGKGWLEPPVLGLDDALADLVLPALEALELRLEAFNVFNRVNYGPPSGNRSSAAFGTITSTYEARQMQLGAKFTW